MQVNSIDLVQALTVVCNGNKWKTVVDFQIKLLIEDKLIVCALGNLHYQIW